MYAYSSGYQNLDKARKLLSFDIRFSKFILIKNHVNFICNKSTLHPLRILHILQQFYHNKL